MKKHNDRAHAPLSPSAAKRWMSCPASFAACEGIVTKTSEAAKEGTIAHEWSERLRKACSSKDPNDYATQLAILENYDEDMAYHVDNYIDFLDELKSNFSSSKYTNYQEYLETRVRFTENIWGTLDYGATRERKGKYEAIISDLKYGRGVYVPVKDNPQLIIYLIGLENHLEVRFERAWIYIYQPRIEKEKPFERMLITRKEIDTWRSNLIGAEQICLEMKAGTVEKKYAAGDHCQFCPAQPTCPTFKRHVQSDALKILDDEVPMLPPIERVPLEILIELHKRKKQIEHYLENVDHYLLGLGLRGKKIGDLKIVEGKSNRRWLEDENEVAQGLKKLGAQPWRKKLITIGAAEKIVGKNKIDHLTTKPPGKVQLALSDDTRPLAKLGKNLLSLLD